MVAAFLYHVEFLAWVYLSCGFLPWWLNVYIFYFIILEGIIFSLFEHWLLKNVYFCSVGGEKTTVARKHFVLSPKLKFRQNFKQGAEATNAHSVYMQVVCVLHTAHVYITAWEYCFFIVHLVRAFGDAYKLMDVRRQVSRLSCFYTPTKRTVPGLHGQV